MAGLPDNWDDINDHVVIAGTAEFSETSKCFTEENLEKVEKDGDLLQRAQIGNKIYECAGFEILDAGGQHSGSILALLDITMHMGMVEKVKQQNIIFALAIFIISLFISILLSLLLSNPIKKLTRVSQDITQGNLNARAEVASKDEIGILAQNFNQMTDSLIETRKLPENIIRSMADSLIVITPEAKIKEVNQATLDLLGYERKELVGQPIEKVFGRAAAAETFKREAAEKMAGELEVKVKERTIQLDASNQQLKATNQQLAAAQKQLQDKIVELERFNKITMGREMRILELKEEVARLKDGHQEGKKT